METELAWGGNVRNCGFDIKLKTDIESTRGHTSRAIAPEARTEMVAIGVNTFRTPTTDSID